MIDPGASRPFSPWEGFADEAHPVEMHSFAIPASRFMIGAMKPTASSRSATPSE